MKSRAQFVRLPLVVLLAVLSCVDPASAQSDNFGSVYSRFGLGERVMPFSPISEAMGGGGFGLGGTAYASLGNPSALADLTLTRALAGFRFQNLEATDGLGAMSTESSLELAGFTLGVPLLSGRLGAAVGLTPYTRTGFRVQKAGSFDPGPIITTSTDYTSSFEGNGGLDRLSVGVGYKVAEGLALGLRGDFAFGIVEDVQRLSFSDNKYKEVRLAKATRLRGFSAGLGVRGYKMSVFRDGDVLSVGAFVDTPTHLTGDRIYSVGSTFEPDSLGAAVDGSMDLPMTLGGGLAYQSGSKLAIVADALYEPWSTFESTFDVAGYAPTGASGMKDRTRFSAGLEFYPAGRDLLAGLLKRTAYRFGVFVERSYVTPDPTRDVRTIGLTGGLSFPTLFPGTRVDMNVEVGNRGSTEDLFVKDRYIRFAVNVNFADRWFVRRPLN